MNHRVQIVNLQLHHAMGCPRLPAPAGDCQLVRTLGFLNRG